MTLMIVLIALALLLLSIHVIKLLLQHHIIRVKGKLELVEGCSYEFEIDYVSENQTRNATFLKMKLFICSVSQTSCIASQE